MKKTIILAFIITFVSCDLLFKNELDQEGIEYIKSLELLESDEEIIWYVTLMDVKSSGNFLTNKRISSYWTYGRKEEHRKYFVYLKDIDSISLNDLSHTITYSSHINVYSKGKNYKVYLDNDSITTKDYFQKTQLEINKVKRLNK